MAAIAAVVVAEAVSAPDRGAPVASKVAEVAKVVAIARVAVEAEAVLMVVDSAVVVDRS